MERPADHCFPLHEPLRQRWSPLAFADRPVSPELLGSLFEAARWAASCYNEQPWAFVLATRDQPADFERLASCLVEANRAWAARAPVLFVTAAKRTFDRAGEANRHAWYDLGQAVANLAIQATSLGLYVHQMAGFDPERARAVCRIPASHEPATMIAVGYYGEQAALAPALQERERGARTRHPLGSFAFAGTWGQPWQAPAKP